jgi:fructose-1,6-bisphosphatase
MNNVTQQWLEPVEIESIFDNTLSSAIEDLIELHSKHASKFQRLIVKKKYPDDFSLYGVRELTDEEKESQQRIEKRINDAEFERYQQLKQKFE